MLILFALLPCLPFARAHMTIWDKAMFALNGPLGCDPEMCGGLPSHPFSGMSPLSSWWFHGPDFTTPAQLPSPSDAKILPAGGRAYFEIACRKNYTSFGDSPSTPGSVYDACPDTPVAYHADPLGRVVKKPLIAGCAIALFDSTDWRDATMDNLAVISIQPECMKQKITSFDIPVNMPPCTGAYCICAWFWLPETGAENYYMTGFYCSITGGSTEYRISAPKDPVFCLGDPSKCVKRAKKAIYAYNSPFNVVSPGIDAGIRPGYHAGWSYTIQGAQDDIFEFVNGTSTTTPAPDTVTTSSFILNPSPTWEPISATTSGCSATATASSTCSKSSLRSIPFPHLSPLSSSKFRRVLKARHS